MDIIEPVSRSSGLINVMDCFVLIIDVQSPFMTGLAPEELEIFIQKYCHLIKLCQLLEIPLIVTAEDIQKNGSVPPELLKLLNSNVHVLDKFIYSCWGQKNIQEVIKSTQRKVAVLCGFETDVCVSQTSIDLLELGYRVVLLTDVIYSRNETEHEIGLKRMEYHGAIISLLKSWQEEITAGIRTKINVKIKRHDLADI
ncbi:MAG: isochorismatase family protein [Candidatus Hodarchaeales archaeon]|jgi:nicotinamidase-related amidase